MLEEDDISPIFEDKHILHHDSKKSLHGATDPKDTDNYTETAKSTRSAVGQRKGPMKIGTPLVEDTISPMLQSTKNPAKNSKEWNMPATQPDASKISATRSDVSNTKLSEKDLKNKTFSVSKSSSSTSEKITASPSHRSQNDLGTIATSNSQSQYDVDTVYTTHSHNDATTVASSSSSDSSEDDEHHTGGFFTNFIGADFRKLFF
eukprot:11281399-Ditylum_brightwellii.AAC.1